MKSQRHLLEKSFILLDKNKIKKWIKNKSIPIHIFEKMTSTNDYLKNNTNDQKIEVCIAEMQTQGRGRFGKVWYSPFGQNIYFSMRYAFEKNIDELSGLSLIAALAVTNAISSITTINHLNIKWPNDILFEHKKIAGILIDLQAEPNGYCHAVIGIGINVNMETAHQNQINQAWNSLQKITGKYIDRNQLSAILINSLIDYLARFSNAGLHHFMDEWKQQDYLSGRSIQILSRSNQFNGIAAGINAQGHLILMMPDKSMCTFSSGDTSVLK